MGGEGGEGDKKGGENRFSRCLNPSAAGKKFRGFGEKKKRGKKKGILKLSKPIQERGRREKNPEFCHFTPSFRSAFGTVWRNFVVVVIFLFLFFSPFPVSRSFNRRIFPLIGERGGGEWFISWFFCSCPDLLAKSRPQQKRGSAGGEKTRKKTRKKTEKKPQKTNKKNHQKSPSRNSP